MTPVAQVLAAQMLYVEMEYVLVYQNTKEILM